MSSDSLNKFQHFFSKESNIEHRFIPEYQKLEEITNELKKEGYRIVLTQGVYDLIHEGHALYLEAAKSHGDVLVVGVDSDELTRLRKGPNRPIVPQHERVKMLIHLRHVDIVTLRESNHENGDLIRVIKPDVLITSASTSDFTDNHKEEYRKYCKEVITLPPQATTSTTARIRNITIEGAENLACEIKKMAEDFIDKIKKG